MEAKVAIGPTVTIGGIRLVPIVKTWLGHWQTSDSVSFLGLMAPIDVIVVRPGAMTAFTMSGEGTTLEGLAEEYPELRPALEGL